MSALAAPPDARICDYCQQPATGPTARLRPGDPTAPLADVTHDDCYRRLLHDSVEAAR